MTILHFIEPKKRFQLKLMEELYIQLLFKLFAILLNFGVLVIELIESIFSFIGLKMRF